MWHDSILVSKVWSLQRTQGDSIEPDVRGQVAANSNAPKRALKLLANDIEPDVRAEVAANTNTPQRALKLLADDYEPAVHRAAAANPGFFGIK